MYKIMLVEDEIPVRESMVQNTDWNALGFDVPVACADGREAMEQYALVRPDVVITDICMPFVDGLELTEHIRAQDQTTIIVVLTGFSEFSYAQKAIKYHVNDYILKPVSPRDFDQLLRRLSHELREREQRQGLFHRAQYAGELLKDHVFQSILSPDTPEEDLQAAAKNAGIVFGGELHIAALIEGAEADGAYLARVAGQAAEGCAPCQWRQAADGMLVMIFSGDETAELRVRAVSACRRLSQKLEDSELLDTPLVGVSGVHAGPGGLHAAAKSARHALGYAFATGQRLLFDSELTKSAGSLHTPDCPAVGDIAACVQSGDGTRALELTGRLFLLMRRRQVHFDECLAQLEQLRVLLTSRLGRDELARTPQLDPLTHRESLEAVRLRFERLEGYLLQRAATEMDSPASRCAHMAMRYLQQNYANCDLKLADVLEHLGVSRSYFSNVFKAQTGQSFVEYLTNLRMDEAKRLLRETGLCTYEIAERIGFVDPHYFSVSFRRRTGMTPREYREANR